MTVRPTRVSGAGRSGSIATLVGPEVVAAILVPAVYLAGLGLLLRYGGLAEFLVGERGATGPAASPAASAPAGPGPASIPHTILTIQVANQRLTVIVSSLKAELDRVVKRPAALDVPRTIQLMRDLNVNIGLGLSALPTLQQRAETADLAHRLRTMYEAMRTLSNDALANTSAAWGEYRKGASRLVTYLKDLATIEADVEAAAAAWIRAAESPLPASGSAGGSTPPPGATPAAPAVAGPSTPAPSPVASPTPAPPSTPVPPTPVAATLIAPTPVPTSQPGGIGGNLANGGFESGTDPWQLVLRSDLNRATLTLDSDLPMAGLASARIDISETGTSRAGITLRQGGLHLGAGVRYTIRVGLRAAADRDAQVRILGANGETYVIGSATVSNGWTTTNLEFTALIDDPDAVLEINVGRYSGSIWVDEVSLQLTAGRA